eukprot:CAMPEP_0180598834 /NCGR_PEP_ID=MMETSP1037_2-20121125/23078_1 /TAXON_ID=632150 /ORGANISM="Azadinium spinosum, Strain 3D9" /LENGTH=99 /DNA_ID=CAMNT_0022617473 /DNA_START=62 /DNA_END=361 /DNA_ORIENTATION=+
MTVEDPALLHGNLVWDGLGRPQKALLRLPLQHRPDLEDFATDPLLIAIAVVLHPDCDFVLQVEAQRFPLIRQDDGGGPLGQCYLRLRETPLTADHLVEI